LRFDRHELDAATVIVRRHVPPTPQYSWPLLNELVGSRVIVKHENHTPVGMGSGINALIAVRDLLGLDTQIVGVVSEQAPSTLLSFERGEVVTTERAATFVDGVATRSPDPESIAGIIAGAARVIAVSDDATADAMRIIYRTTHNVAESAGAIALAGLLSEPSDRRGERSAFVLCGGNVDTAQLHAVLGGATPTA